MAEPLSLIDTINTNTNNNNISVTENSCGELSFRRIEFHLASKPFTGFNKDGGFSVETLNNNNNNNNISNNNQQSVGSESVGLSGKKRDASELLDQELSFQITIRRIGAGLENLGNTCFLNSVLQCLTYTEPLAAYLQSGKHQVTCRKSGFCALCAIQNHVSRALQLPGRSLAPKDLVSNLRCISRTFRNSRQEDAHEYMVNLLESMHKCCLPKEVPIESQSAYDKSLVHKIFGGQLRSQVKCMQCNHCSNKFDPFLDISLEILNADSLYKAFAQFTAKEHLDGGAKAYQCQQCKQKVKALKQLTVYKAPNVLTVHLKRFGCYMSGQKIDKKVHFGPILDLKPFVTGPYDGDLKYTLYGVLVHAGWSTRSGHYYCFVRTSSGMWYALDDNRVFQVSEKTVFEQKAYMLFYFKDRNNFSSKKAKDFHQKEKIVMNGSPNGPREAQVKAGPSNHLLSAQTLMKKTANVAQQKENIVMTGAPNGPSAPSEAQIKTVPSNCSINAQTSLKETADAAQQKENIVMNGTPNGPGAPAEAQMNTGLSSVAPKEAQTNTLLGNESLNDDKSLNSVSTSTCSDASKEAHMKTGLNDVSVNVQKSLAAFGAEGNGLGPVAPKETQMETGLSDGSLNAQKSLAAVGTEGNGLSPVAPIDTQMETGLKYGSLNAQKSLAAVRAEENVLAPVAPKETQMETGLNDGSLNAQKSLAAVGTEGNGLSPVAPKETQTDFKLNTDASEPEKTQTKETSVSKTTSEPSKTEDHEKEIDEGESALLKISDPGGKPHNTELSDLPQKESSIKKKKKALKEKPHKKAKNLFKCKLTSMKISSNVLLGATLNQRKKKKHKRNKRVKNLAQENLVNESSPTMVKIEVQETVKLIVDDNGFKPRVVEDGAVLATGDFNNGSQSKPNESNQSSQRSFLHMLTRGIDERTVPRWDDDESAQSRIFSEERLDFAIGYTGDHWDEEYDRGKRKKVKTSKTEFDGRNPFQDIANERLKSHSQKRKSNLSKKKNKHFKESRSSNVPYRI